MNAEASAAPTVPTSRVAFAIAIAAFIAITLLVGAAAKRPGAAPRVAAAPAPKSQAVRAPLPAPVEVTGTTSAQFTLAAQPAALKAWISGSTDAKLEPGGSVEIRVFANGAECNGKRYYRESFMGPAYALNMACEVNVPAGTPAVFRAEMSVDKGTAGLLALRARYEH
jgi:hypothetical protein